MKYDFTTLLDRIGHDAIAVDRPYAYQEPFTGFVRKEGFDIIPMWVADMNFIACPTIPAAIEARLSHGAYGYFDVRPEYYDAILSWQKTRNHITDLDPSMIGYENGLLGGVTSALNALAKKGDAILIHSPTYIGFTHILEDDGFRIVHSPLKFGSDNRWYMDYEDMEKAIVKENIKVMLLCNPHNPCGRVWTREELQKAVEICERHQVWIISDEIWSDILLNGHVHTPVQTINAYAKSHTAAFYSPAKTFNLAGIIGAYHIIYDPQLRERIVQQSILSHYNSPNLLSMYALLGAYKPEGEEWTDQLNEVLSTNADFIMDYMAQNLLEIHAAKPEGTYMLFVDCEEYCKKHQVSIDDLLKRAWEYGVYYQDGRPFHGEYAIRMNFALPTAKVKEAFARLKKYVFVD
jgi:cystathionine beta-lyase